MCFHGNGQQYYDAVVDHAGASAITIPSLDDPANALAVLDHVSGVLLTGSFSDIHPETYGAEPDAGHSGFFDRARDKSSVAVISHSISTGIPLLGICRGLQELNVAMGGTLHQILHTVSGRDDHRSDESLPLPEQFLPAHPITIESDGVLASIADSIDGKRRVTVNTSHAQGIDRLGEGLRVEATSDDGTIEAVSVDTAANFALAVQFHPEWNIGTSPLYRALFEAFGRAVSAYHESTAAHRCR